MLSFDNLTRDEHIMLRVLHTYGHFPRRTAVEIVAREEGLQIPSVSGMASRAQATIRGAALLLEASTRDPQWEDNSVATMQTIVDDHRGVYAELLSELHDHPGRVWAMYISDVHYPTQDTGALLLVRTIIEALIEAGQEIAFVAAMGDSSNLDNVSRYPSKNRATREALIGQDFEKVIRGDEMILELVRGPYGTAGSIFGIALPGNHCVRMLNTEFGNYLNLKRMEALAAENVLFLDLPTREHFVNLTPQLAWGHGISHSANPVTVAKRTVEAWCAENPGVRTIPDIVVGHTHRRATVAHNNATVYLSGHMAREDKFSYVRNPPASHETGFVASYIDFSTGEHTTYNVPITILPLEPGKGRDGVCRYTARLAGTEYIVEV